MPIRCLIRSQSLVKSLSVIIGFFLIEYAEGTDHDLFRAIPEIVLTLIFQSNPKGAKAGWIAFPICAI